MHIDMCGIEDMKKPRIDDTDIVMVQACNGAGLPAKHCERSFRLQLLLQPP